MPRSNWIRFLAWASVVSGGLLFVLESLHGLRYGGSAASIIIDYIAAALLFYGGTRSLRSLPEGAPGLLLGGWSYALCDAYRAIWWRTEHYFSSENPAPLREPFGVYVVLLGLGALTLFFFGLSFVLAHPRKVAAGT